MENKSIPRNYRNFTPAFKLSVVAKSEKIGTVAAAREFGINERSIRRWRVHKEQLEKMPPKVDDLYWPEIEKELESWIKEHISTKVPLSVLEICSKAKIISQQMGITDFKGDRKWYNKFMKREKLYVNSKPAIKKSQEYCNKQNFLDHVFDTVQQQNLTNAQIINMDEIPFSFHFIDDIENKKVPMLIASNEAVSFSCVLSCTANGTKLKPFIIFKCNTLPKGNYPSDSIIRSNVKGRMCENLIIDWLWEVWRKRRGAIFDPQGILIVNSVQGQLLESVRGEYEKMCSTLAIIPANLTNSLNPLSLISKTFEMEMIRHYKEWFDSTTKKGKLGISTPEDIAKWVSDSWRSVNVSTIIYGFTETNILANNDINLDSVEIFRKGQNIVENPEKLSDDEFLKHFFNSDSDESEFEGFCDYES